MSSLDLRSTADEDRNACLRNGGPDRPNLDSGQTTVSENEIHNRSRPSLSSRSPTDAREESKSRVVGEEASHGKDTQMKTQRPSMLGQWSCSARQKRPTGKCGIAATRRENNPYGPNGRMRHDSPVSFGCSRGRQIHPMPHSMPLRMDQHNHAHRSGLVHYENMQVQLG